MQMSLVQFKANLILMGFYDKYGNDSLYYECKNKGYFIRVSDENIPQITMDVYKIDSSGWINKVYSDASNYSLVTRLEEIEKAIDRYDTQTV